MKKSFALIFALAALVPLTAQPVFTAEDLPDIGYEATWVQDTADDITVDVGSTGGPQTWNFSRSVAGLSETFLVLSPEGTPAEDSFPDADFVQYINGMLLDTIPGELWNYAQITSDNVLILGDYAEGMFLGSPISLFKDYNPDRIITPIPLEMDAEWKDSFYRADTIDDVGLINVRIWSVSHNTVDAWGTVIVPAGSFEALRIIRYDTTIDIVTLFTPQPPETTRTIQYSWVAANAGTVASIVSQNNETDPQFTIAQDYVVLLEHTGVSELQQPNIPSFIRTSGNEVFFYTENPGNVELTVYDATGRRTATLFEGSIEAGEHSIPIPKNLSSGVYFVRMKTPAESISAKFVVIN